MTDLTDPTDLTDLTNLTNLTDLTDPTDITKLTDLTDPTTPTTPTTLISLTTLTLPKRTQHHYWYDGLTQWQLTTDHWLQENFEHLIFFFNPSKSVTRVANFHTILYSCAERVWASSSFGQPPRRSCTHTSSSPSKSTRPPTGCNFLSFKPSNWLQSSSPSNPPTGCNFIQRLSCLSDGTGWERRSRHGKSLERRNFLAHWDRAVAALA